jgi:hypothetical protein
MYDTTSRLEAHAHFVQLVQRTITNTVYSAPYNKEFTMNICAYGTPIHFAYTPRNVSATVRGRKAHCGVVSHLALRLACIPSREHLL